MLTAGAMPTSRQVSTRISTGKRIQRGGSCGTRGRSSGSLPKKTLMKRREYATLKMPHPTAVTGSHHALAAPPTASASAKNISLERKPLSRGTPAIAALATIARVPV